MSSRVGLGVDVFTSGQVAKICRVAPRTVAQWIDSGLLDGYRIPGSGSYRRVRRAALAKFMHEHSMPLEWLKEFVG